MRCPPYVTVVPARPNPVAVLRRAGSPTGCVAEARCGMSGSVAPSPSPRSWTAGAAWETEKILGSHTTLKTRPYLAIFLITGGICMHRMILVSTLISLLGVHVSSAWAWWDAGHMQIAYAA